MVAIVYRPQCVKMILEGHFILQQPPSSLEPQTQPHSDRFTWNATTETAMSSF